MQMITAGMMTNGEQEVKREEPVHKAGGLSGGKATSKQFLNWLAGPAGIASKTGR